MKLHNKVCITKSVYCLKDKRLSLFFVFFFILNSFKNCPSILGQLAKGHYCLGIFGYFEHVFKQIDTGNRLDKQLLLVEAKCDNMFATKSF